MTPIAKRILFTGVLTGALYLPVVLQMMLGTGFLQRFAQTTTLFFFPLCWATLGLGFLHVSHARRFSTPHLIAVSLLLFFLASHGLPLQIDSQLMLGARLAVCLIPAGMAYFFIGKELSELFGGSGARIHLHYGLFMLGLAAGGAFSDQAVSFIGGNGLILFLITALLLCNLPSKTAAAAITAAFVLITAGGADLHIERLRNVGNYVPLDKPRQVFNPIKDADDMMNGYENAFQDLAWNRRGQTFFYPDQKYRRFAWVLNLQIEHILPFTPAYSPTRFIHTSFKKGQEILLVGIGAGRSLASVNPEALGKNIYAVERDANTVKLVRKNKLNPEVDKINYLAADGRGFLEQSDKKWDWIYIESALDSRNASPLQLFQPQFLYTKEAIDAYISRLNEGGTLVIEVNRAGMGSRFSVIKSIREHFEALKGDHIDTLYMQKLKLGSPDLGTSWAIARRGGAPLAHTIKQMGERFRIREASSIGIEPCLESYSDAAPFLDWMCMSRTKKTHAMLLTLGAMLLFAATTEWSRRRFKTNLPGAGAVRFIFLFQSVAHCFLFLGIAYSLRSIFGDEIGTFYVFNIVTTVVGAGASFFIHHMITRSFRITLNMQILALTVSMAWLAVALNLDITFTGGLPTRILMFASAVVPVYFFSALLFHECLGLARRAPSGLREAFLYDSIAVLPAYAILPWILFQMGIATLLLSAVACYAVSIVLLQRASAAPAATKNSPVSHLILGQ